MATVFRSVVEHLSRRRELAITVLLVVGLVLVLMIPAIRTLRTVEVEPETSGIDFASSELTFQVTLPPGHVDYFIVWFDDNEGTLKLTAADYKGLNLEIRSGTGDLVRTVAGAKFIKRDGKPAIFFNFDTLPGNEGELDTFTLRQQGGAVKARHPILGHIHPGEVAPAAFQLGEKKNLLTLLIAKVYSVDLVGDDISFYLHRGQQIVAGKNPYSCVLDPKETCIGYPSHLPGMYLFAAGAVKLGFDTLDEWVGLWRPIVWAAWLGVGVVLLVHIFRRGQPVLAVASLGFWLLNRWSLYVLTVAHTDFVGVFFLVVSLLVATRLPLLAALLLGISLAIKQIAVLIVPLFLIAIWRFQKPSIKKFSLIVVLVLAVPALVSLPFLFNNAPATVAGWLSIIGHVPQADVHGFAPSLGELLDVTHVGQSVPMLFLVGLVYVSVWRKRLDLMGGTLLVFAIMMGFTHVLYNQYFVWFIPFIPLALVSLAKNSHCDVLEP